MKSKSLKCMAPSKLTQWDQRGCVQQLLAWLKGMSQPMASYFEEYASQPSEWATCFRIGTWANTNMFVKSFHRTLKEIYFKRKQNRRVNHLLFTLRKITRDKAYEQWIKAEKGKVTVRKRESNKRHIQAEAIPSDAVSWQNAEYWQVQSTSDKSKVHHMKKTGSSVCNCIFHCSFCAACVHLFECTCLDYPVRGIVCTHIHAVNIAESTKCLMEIKENHIEEKREWNQRMQLKHFGFFRWTLHLLRILYKSTCVSFNFLWEWLLLLGGIGEWKK